MTIEAPTPNGFLYAWVDTGLAGARSVTRPGGAVITAAENYRPFAEWVALVDAAIYADHGSRLGFDTSTGICTLVPGVSGDFQFDRTGLLTGITNEPGTNYAATSGTPITSNFMPAGAIWLMGAEMSTIKMAREMKFDAFRWKRGYGYSWGGARLYSWKLTMHRESFDMFQKGWGATGKVTLRMGSASDMTYTGTGYTGQLTGHVVGVQNARWLGPAADVAEVSIVIAGAD